MVTNISLLAKEAQATCITGAALNVVKQSFKILKDCAPMK